MGEDIKHYKKEHLTVIWQPGLCQHAKLCWKGLIEVFNPKERPWINMDGAEIAAIVAQVQKCPSGALSFMLEEEVK